MPTARELGCILGGAPCDWGRILKGQQDISGEYHARLKLLKNGGIDSAQFELHAAEKSKDYGKRTRKGKLVPRTKNIYYDIDNFYIQKTVQKMANYRSFDDQYDEYVFVCEQEQMMYSQGPGPRSYVEQKTLEREFINSLT